MEPAAAAPNVDEAAVVAEAGAAPEVAPEAAPAVEEPAPAAEPPPAAEPKEEAAAPTPTPAAARLSWSQRNSLSGGNSPGGSAQMSKASASQQEAASKSKGLGLVDRKALAMGGAGQGGGLGLNAPGHGPAVNHFSGKRGSAKATVDVAEEIGTTWQQIMDDSNPTGWLVCEYSADSKKLLLKAKGEGGLTPFKAALGDNLAWGSFRCNAVDKRGGVECKRPKFVFVMYKPEEVSMIKKAKQASHKGDVKDAITGAHLDIVVESMADLEEQDLITKLQAATGAHKPNGYEFDEGNFMEADFYGLGIGKDCKSETAKS